MENTDYKAAIKACMEIESGDDVLDFYENHGTAIFRALRFAEKMMQEPSDRMAFIGTMRDQVLKELGE